MRGFKPACARRSRSCAPRSRASALLVAASDVLAQPGALTVNCVRGTVACQEAERLRARVEVLERVREAAPPHLFEPSMESGTKLLKALQEAKP